MTEHLNLGDLNGDRKVHNYVCKTLQGLIERSLRPHIK